MLFINFLQVINLVALADKTVQECFGEGTFEKASVKDGFANNHAKELEKRLVIIKALAHVVWHEFAITFIFHKVCIFRIKDFVTKLGNELFEETTTINTFFYLAMLIDKPDLPLCSGVELLQEYLIKTILQNVTPIDSNWIPSMVVLCLHFDQILEDLSSEPKGNRMWKIN